jgi:hypothetical protein
MPPTPALWKVEREPSQGAVSIPPAIAMYARAPVLAKDSANVCPALT